MSVPIFSTGSNYINIEGRSATCRDFRRLNVTENFTVQENCFKQCGWNNSLRLPIYEDSHEEQLCNMAPFNTDVLPVKQTGKCVNGSCKPPDSIATRGYKTYPRCRSYETEEYEGEEISLRCDLQYCMLNKSYGEYRNLENGTKCVHTVYANVFTWIGGGSQIKLGTCKKGVCTDTRNSNRRRLPRKKVTVRAGTSVDRSCNLTCNNGTTVPLKNGTMCALRTKDTRSLWFVGPKTTHVQEIGVCQDGSCVQRGKYGVPPHNSSKGCNGTDIYIHENLTLASHCLVDCADGTVEIRDENISCL
ncbi:unnamed protein product, partial [Ixodes hexagonus]